MQSHELNTQVWKFLLGELEPADMSEFGKASEQNWAADSDEEDNSPFHESSAEDDTWQDTKSPVPTEKVQNSFSNNDLLNYADDSDSDESDEEENTNNSTTDNSAPAPSKPVVAAPVKQLSKKEMQALKAKELDDLDSILAEVGIAPSKDPELKDVESSTKKKKKPKKKTDADTAAAAAAQSVVEVVESTPIETRDIKAVLALKKSVSKKSSSNGTTSAAVAEALKAAEAEKNSKKAKKAAAKARETFDR